MNSSSTFSWLEFEALRHAYLATMGIYLSSSCPVKCAHCAVAASVHPAGKPGERFFTMVREMRQLPGLVAVAVTGGEPFFEPDLLQYLVEEFSQAGKRIVVYTSGYWGEKEILKKVIPVLDSVNGLVFGVDHYHRARIADDDLIRAMRCGAEHGAWITAQVLRGVDDDIHFEYANSVLEKAFGREWEKTARIASIFPAPSGRASKIEAFHEYHGLPLEYCDGINGPTLLRNGVLAACCNEEVVRQKGPEVFRVASLDPLEGCLKALEDRLLLMYLRYLPPATLRSLALQCMQPGSLIQSERLCKACWEFVDLYTRMNGRQRLKFDEMVRFMVDARNPKQVDQAGNVQSFPADVSQAFHV
jgi:hypothetical protein